MQFQISRKINKKLSKYYVNSDKSINFAEQKKKGTTENRDHPILTPDLQQRSDARVAEEARLESVYTPKAYREFESRSLRLKEIHCK